MSDDPVTAFLAYIRAFETSDPEAISPFYHLPSMFIAPQGIFAVPDGATLRMLLSGYIAHLRAQSYRRTEISDLQVRALSSTLALCTGVFVRVDVDGQEIARLGFTYTMRHSDGSWKIVVAAVHDPIAAP